MTAHLYEFFESQIIENRRAPRYAVEERGTLCGAPVEVRNVSRSGAQLACPTRDYDQIAEALGRPPVPVELDLGTALSLEAEPIYANRGDDHYLIGVRFVGMRRRQQAALDAYIDTLS